MKRTSSALTDSRMRLATVVLPEPVPPQIPMIMIRCYLSDKLQFVALLASPLPSGRGVRGEGLTRASPHPSPPPGRGREIERQTEVCRTRQLTSPKPPDNARKQTCERYA